MRLKHLLRCHDECDVYLSGSEQANSAKDDKLCHFVRPEYVRRTIFPSCVELSVPTDSIVLTYDRSAGEKGRLVGNNPIRDRT